jgi:N utilization substance protein B
VDRSILRLGAYQLFCTDIPGKVVINEAIEIAKKYSGEQAPRFVNGVLDAILKKLTGQE